MAKRQPKSAPLVDPSSGLPICGLVMPISGLDGQPPEHWLEVKKILEDSILRAGFSAQLVSDGDNTSVIQGRIVQNLYEHPIVVVDVSGKNPNVMFELGLRLAFDKPTVIIKDDKTDYSFDTNVIEHVSYRRDLRHSSIEQFKEVLAEKVRSVFQKSAQPSYKTFLKHFGSFTVAHIKSTEVSPDQFIINELKAIQGTLLRWEQAPHKRDSFADHEMAARSLIRTLVEMMPKDQGALTSIQLQNFVDRLIADHGVPVGLHKVSWRLMLTQAINDAIGVIE